VQPSAAAPKARAVEEPDNAGAAGREVLSMPAQLPQGGSDARLPSVLPEPVFGVTITDVTPLYTIQEALGSLSRKPTTRIVFDAERSGLSYLPAVRELADVSYIMGELVDSVDVSGLSVEAYAARTTDFLNELEPFVDIWEVGNDVNGEWLGAADAVAAKVHAAFELVEQRGAASALTFNYNEGCVQNPEHELFSWALAHVSSDMRRGLDYVWVSYFEQRCHHPEPDWNLVFARLHALFPHAKLGFGACGVEDPGRKVETLKHFYGLEVEVPNFVGGYFWWFFREDMQPSNKPLWAVLDQTAQASPQ